MSDRKTTSMDASRGSDSLSSYKSTGRRSRGASAPDSEAYVMLMPLSLNHGRRIRTDTDRSEGHTEKGSISSISSLSGTAASSYRRSTNRKPSSLSAFIGTLDFSDEGSAARHARAEALTKRFPDLAGGETDVDRSDRHARAEYLISKLSSASVTATAARHLHPQSTAPSTGANTSPGSAVRSTASLMPSSHLETSARTPSSSSRTDRANYIDATSHSRFNRCTSAFSRYCTKITTAAREPFKRTRKCTVSSASDSGEINWSLVPSSSDSATGQTGGRAAGFLSGVYFDPTDADALFDPSRPRSSCPDRPPVRPRRRRDHAWQRHYAKSTLRSAVSRVFRSSASRLKSSISPPIYTETGVSDVDSIGRHRAVTLWNLEHGSRYPSTSPKKWVIRKATRPTTTALGCASSATAAQMGYYVPRTLPDPTSLTPTASATATDAASAFLYQNRYSYYSAAARAGMSSSP